MNCAGSRSHLQHSEFVQTESFEPETTNPDGPLNFVYRENVQVKLEGRFNHWRLRMTQKDTGSREDHFDPLTTSSERTSRLPHFSSPRQEQTGFQELDPAWLLAPGVGPTVWPTGEAWGSSPFRWHPPL